MASRDHPSVAGRARHRRLSYENRVFLVALAAGVVPAAIASFFLFTYPLSDETRWTLSAFMLVFWIGFAAEVRSIVMRPLQTMANMQAAVREGDFSMRARSTGLNDSLSDLMYEMNELSATLRDQRLDAFEANTIMRKVLGEIDVAVFAFDSTHRLRLMNRAAERLTGAISEHALGSTAEKLGIHDLLEGEETRTLDYSFRGGTGRWSVRRSTFRQGGAPHHLVVVTDLSRALREEERQAWQRLVRVLGHELNNSLAPIKSISHSLQSLLRHDPRPSNWEEDLGRGLQILADRSEALTRFVADYSRLARLPKPNLQSVEVGPLLRRVCALDNRVPVQLTCGAEVVITADCDQLEQLFVNLLRNGIEASAESCGKVEVAWTVTADWLRVRIVDEGPGIANPANLFVPFFTTKPGGSGIGLVLSRQIADAHGGQITLANRTDACGCEAVVNLPRNR